MSDATRKLIERARNQAHGSWLPANRLLRELADALEQAPTREAVQHELAVCMWAARYANFDVMTDEEEERFVEACSNRSASRLFPEPDPECEFDAGESPCKRGMTLREIADDEYVWEEPEVGSDDKGEVSDGYHTFNELYDHRHALFLALISRVCPLDSWMSLKHEDGSTFEGWFIAGVELSSGSITYHLPMHLWDVCKASGAIVLDRGREWDGHTAQDVVARLILHAKRDAEAVEGGAEPKEGTETC